MAGTKPTLAVPEDEGSDSAPDTESEMAEAYEKVLRAKPEATRGHKHLPPLRIDRAVEKKFIQPTKVFAQRTDQGIISVPEGGGDSMKHEDVEGLQHPDHGMANVARPGPHRAHRPQGPPSIDIVIYFMDKTGLTLPVLDGQHAEAGELFEMVMQEQELPHEAREVFSLWMVSDLLELQLKPNHVPFRLTCQWDELLEKYTTAEKEDIERDEPVIMFQRNVFYPRSKETLITDPRLIRMLYYEAKENVVDGRYPVEEEVASLFAGMHAVVKHGQYRSDQHTPAFYKNSTEEYYPSQFCKRGISLFKSKLKAENVISASHARVSRDYDQINPETQLRIMSNLLEKCREMPYYGSAYFNGQVEKPSKFNILGTSDNPVYIAVNTEGVHIIDMDKVEVLLSLSYDQFSWEYGEPEDTEDRDKLPCLFLQFKDHENNRPVSKMLQVYSREAGMVDGLIEACVGLNAQKPLQIVSRGARAPQTRSMSESGSLERKMNKLCVSTFDRTGDLLNTKVRTLSKKKKSQSEHNVQS